MFGLLEEEIDPGVDGYNASTTTKEKHPFKLCLANTVHRERDREREREGEREREREGERERERGREREGGRERESVKVTLYIKDDQCLPPSISSRSAFPESKSLCASMFIA